MPNVNLIAVRRAEKKRMEQLTRQLFLGLAVSVAGLFVLAFFLAGQRIVLQGRLTEAKKKLQDIQPVLNEIAQKEKDTADLKPKVDTLENAKMGTARYRNLFQVVSRSLPASTWLASLTSGGTADSSTIVLTGVSGSQTLVGDLMTNLQKVPLFEKVDLKYTSQANDDHGGHRFGFQMDAHLKSLAPPAAPPTPKTADTAVPKNNTTGGQNGHS